MMSLWALGKQRWQIRPKAPATEKKFSEGTGILKQISKKPFVEMTLMSKTTCLETLVFLHHAFVVFCSTLPSFLFFLFRAVPDTCRAEKKPLYWGQDVSESLVCVHIWQVWDGAASGRCLRVYTCHSGAVRDACWTPCGQQLLTASFDNTAAITDVETGR